MNSVIKALPHRYGHMRAYSVRIGHRVIEVLTTGNQADAFRQACAAFGLKMSQRISEVV
jgi:hypothetical protein